MCEHCVKVGVQYLKSTKLQHSSDIVTTLFERCQPTKVPTFTQHCTNIEKLHDFRHCHNVSRTLEEQIKNQKFDFPFEKLKF